MTSSLFLCFVFLIYKCSCQIETQFFKIEGKVSVVVDRQRSNTEWMIDTTILVNGGDYKGFLRADGTFTVNGVPSGSHIVEVQSANYEFEKYRVDINKGGKVRARRINFIQPNAVQVVPYPLRFVSSRQESFFEIREQWKITDALLNPMVLMMVLPILFVFVMPKLMSMADPEAQKDVQAQMNMFQNKNSLPDTGELMSSLFGGAAANEAKKKKLALGADKSGVKKAGKRR